MVLAQQAKCACMTAQRGYSTGKAFQPADAYPQPLINHPKNAVKTQKSGFPEVSNFNSAAHLEDWIDRQIG